MRALYFIAALLTAWKLNQDGFWVERYDIIWRNVAGYPFRLRLNRSSSRLADHFGILVLLLLLVILALAVTTVESTSTLRSDHVEQRMLALHAA